MTSFFDVAAQQPLCLASVAKKIQTPKQRSGRSIPQRGSASLFGLFFLLGMAAFSVIFFCLQKAALFGVQQFAVYALIAMGAFLLLSYFFAPFRKQGRFHYANVACGMTAMASILVGTMPYVAYPEAVWKAADNLSIVHMYDFELPNDKEIDLLTRVVYGEARGETPQDQSNIVHTILNRAANPNRRYGKRIADVLLAPKAFSCLNPSDQNYKKLLELPKNSLTYKKIHDNIVKTIVARMNGLGDPTRGSTHYHTAAVDPHWNRNAKSMIKLGAHQFWVGVDD